jgi:hypothetical protein
MSIDWKRLRSKAEGADFGLCATCRASCSRGKPDGKTSKPRIQQAGQKRRTNLLMVLSIRPIEPTGDGENSPFCDRRDARDIDVRKISLADQQASSKCRKVPA